MQKSVTDKYTSANLVLKEKDDLGQLLVGDCTSAADKHILKPHKIQTIITIGQDSEPEKKEEGIHYVLFNVLDNKSQKIGDLFDKVYDEIEDGRMKGGVLVHCFTGISRSSSFVIAYLMKKRAISYDQARAFVKKQRNVAHPNDNFHRQLQNYDKLLQKKREEEKQRRLKEQVQPKQKEQTNTTSINNVSSDLTNLSGVSKRTLRGVKGAVKPAIREESIQKKSIDNSIEKVIEKTESPKPENLRKQRQDSTGKQKEEKKKKVQNVYGNKTKVF